MQVNYQTIKSNAELRWLSRNQLRGNWGTAILVYIIFACISGAASGVLIGPMTVGLSFCFINMVRYVNMRIEDVFEGFKKFGTSFLAYLLMGIFTFLWSLLLIVPGIIAGLSYAMTPYIINDNPGISATDAIRLSKEMMKGFKWKLFLLQLSFIGWGILSLFTCFVGLLWLIPYVMLSEANFYENLRFSYGLGYASNIGGYNNMNGYNTNTYNGANYSNNMNGFNSNYNNYQNNYNPNNSGSGNYNNNYYNQNNYNTMNGSGMYNDNGAVTPTNVSDTNSTLPDRGANNPNNTGL